ncbi:hypothetical protein IW261DRAFT_1559080 [Armillaria novae-zelandiae]|uniref:Uncharacterized protein n=1 Tax=Armillaria novae-zelandiae TaxID=153914 RepID=A0AA39PL92_9AGAR|nr:hypothetical protein IW261DRAFT_1559080 [Armillaria novae-zelandiae]
MSAPADDLPLWPPSPIDEVIADNCDHSIQPQMDENTTGEHSIGDETEESGDEGGDSAMADKDKAAGDGDDNEEDQQAGIWTETDAMAVLRSCRYVVNAMYQVIICIDCNHVIQYKSMYQHRRAFHSAYHKISSHKLGKSHLRFCLQQLQADQPRYPPPSCEPIPCVAYLKVAEFWGCGVSGCSFKMLSPSMQACKKNHSNIEHCNLSNAQRWPVRVPGHCFRKQKAKSLYVRVIQATIPSTLPSDNLLSLILQHSKARGVGEPPKTLVISDK